MIKPKSGSSPNASLTGGADSGITTSAELGSQRRGGLERELSGHSLDTEDGGWGSKGKSAPKPEKKRNSVDRIMDVNQKKPWLTSTKASLEHIDNVLAQVTMPDPRDLGDTSVGRPPADPKFQLAVDERAAQAPALAQMLEAIAGRDEAVDVDLDVEEAPSSPTEELKSLMATVSLLDSKLANLEDATDSFREPNRGIYASSVLGGNAIAPPSPSAVTQSMAATLSSEGAAAQTQTLAPEQASAAARNQTPLSQKSAKRSGR
jgi:hypothetical protein